MRRWAVIMVGLGAVSGTMAMAQDITLPSGQTVQFIDVIVEDAPPVARFRFLAPEIDPAGAGRTYETIMPDFATLCTEYALPALQASGLVVPEVVISMADRPVEFGIANPEATQFFEPFSVADGACIWEQF